MTLTEFMEVRGLTDAEMAAAAGIDRTYVTHLRNGTKPINLPIALTLFRRTGQKFGPLNDLDDDAIALLERLTVKAS